jgi:excinuclease UvrABC nuclease subunit
MLKNKRYPFTAWAIAGAPEDPGVYCLWIAEELIYIGSAEAPSSGIKARLSEHFAGQTTAGFIATHYAWEISRRPCARAHELLLEFQRLFEGRPRLNGVADKSTG